MSKQTNNQSNQQTVTSLLEVHYGDLYSNKTPLDGSDSWKVAGCQEETFFICSVVNLLFVEGRRLEIVLRPHGLMFRDETFHLPL